MMLTQVSDWLELKWWQLAVQALSATRALGGARPVGGRVLRAAAQAAQRASERAHSRQVQQTLQAEYIAAELYGAADGLGKPGLWVRLADNWTFVALAGWILGLAVGLALVTGLW